LQVASLDLLSIEWPVGDPTELAATWCKLEVGGSGRGLEGV